MQDIKIPAEIPATRNSLKCNIIKVKINNPIISNTLLSINHPKRFSKLKNKLKKPIENPAIKAIF